MPFVKKIISRKYPYVIAEIGINHNGDMKLAQEMIISAKENGADCVKFQSFIADKYIAPYSIKANYQKKSRHYKKQSQREIIKSCEVSTDQLVSLKKFAHYFELALFIFNLKSINYSTRFIVASR